MKTKSDLAGYFRPLVILVAVIFSVVTAQANPIELPEKSITPEISLVIGVAILLEVICIWLVLRRARRPRFFVLWNAPDHIPGVSGRALDAARFTSGFGCGRR